MPRSPTITQAALARALKAAKEAGIPVTSCVLTPQQAVIKFGEKIHVDPENATQDNPQPKQWQ